jgi:hypothetical protein
MVCSFISYNYKISQLCETVIDIKVFRMQWHFHNLQGDDKAT